MGANEKYEALVSSLIQDIKHLQIMQTSKIRHNYKGAILPYDVDYARDYNAKYLKTNDSYNTHFARRMIQDIEQGRFERFDVDMLANYLDTASPSDFNKIYQSLMNVVYDTDKNVSWLTKIFLFIRDKISSWINNRKY